MNSGDRIGSYILDGELGRGVSATTWLAHPEGLDTPAVLKILDLADTSSWNAVDIFKREAEALKSLSHPGIPRYLDYFESGENGRTRLVLAMERVEGRNLDAIVRSGMKFAETEVERMMADLAEILAYLGSLRPPIVHRDVNPRNVIMKPNGVVALVDFSGVQDAVRNALYPGATLVGTAGYIPLEQVAGKASHRSDLYGAAATAVFLLTGRNPAELPTSGLRIRLDGIVDISPRLAKVLGSWLDPDVSSRNLPASEAVRILRGQTVIPEHTESAEVPAPLKAQPPVRLPADSKILVDQADGTLHIRIPPAGTRGRSVPGMTFATFWIAFVAFWTLMSFMMRAPIFFSAFSIPFWAVGFGLAKRFLGSAISTQDIMVTGNSLDLRTRTAGFERTASWPLEDVGKIEIAVSKIQMGGAHDKELVIEAGTGATRIGSGLSERELIYLKRILEDEFARRRHSFDS